MSAWTLQIADASPVAIEALAVKSATLTTASTGEDSLQLLVVQPVDAADIIPAFARCILRVDDVVRFVGWLDLAPVRADAKSETVTYAINGPWRWLVRTYYQGRGVVNGETQNNVSGKVRLGAELSFSSSKPGDDPEIPHVRVGDQLVTIINNVQAQHPGMWTELLFSPLNLEIPFDDRTDDRAADLVRNLLAYIPSVVMWWDYTIDGAGRPALCIKDQDFLAADRTLTEANLKGCGELSPRIDLLADRVKIIYLQTRTDGSVSRIVDAVSAGGDAAALGADFEALYTFSLQQNELPPASGLASALAKWYSRLHVDVQAAFAVPDWARKPGELWGFGGIFSRLAGRLSVCQSITRTWTEGGEAETIRLGVPAVPTTQLLSKRSSTKQNNTNDNSGGGEGGGGTSSSSATVNVTITGLPGDTLQGQWQIGTQGGQGDGEAKVEPGTYNVVGYPVPDPTSGVLYFANPVDPVELEAGEEKDVEITYQKQALVTGRWQVSLRNETGWQWQVSEIGYVFDSVKPKSKLAVTGQGEWNNAAANDVVFIEVEIAEDGTKTGAIKSHGQGDEFDLDAEPWAEHSTVEDDGGSPAVQKYARLVLAKITVADGVGAVNQVTQADQLLENTIIDGRIAKFFRDWSGGVPA